MRARRAQRRGMINDKQFCPFLFASENKITLQGFSIILEAQRLFKAGSAAPLIPGPIPLSLCPCWAERRCLGPCSPLCPHIRGRRGQTLLLALTRCRASVTSLHLPRGRCPSPVTMSSHKVQLWRVKGWAVLRTHTALLAGD